MVDCKRQYISNLGPSSDGSKLVQKLEYCKDLLALLDKFHPGCNYDRGT